MQGFFNSIWQRKTGKQIAKGGLKLSKKKIIIIIIIAVVAVSIGVFTITPLFTNTVVDEPLPTTSKMSLAALNMQEILIH